MPEAMPLLEQDPPRISRYQLTGRLAVPSAGDPVYLAAAPDGTEVTVAIQPGSYPGGAGLDRFTAEAAAARRVAPFCTARLLDAGVEAAAVPGQRVRARAVAAGGDRHGRPGGRR